MTISGADDAFPLLSQRLPVAASGVDYASSGWITHSAPNLDVALDIEM